MTKTYSIRIDNQTKDAAQKVFNDLGMDFSTGIKIYLKQVIKNDGIPFELSNRDSLEQSLSEYRAGNYKSFETVDELAHDLNN